MSLLVRLSLFSPHGCLFFLFVCLCVSWGCATFQSFLSCPTQLGPSALALYGCGAHALYQVPPIAMRGLSNSEEIRSTFWIPKSWCLNELSRPVLGGYQEWTRVSKGYHSAITRLSLFETFMLFYEIKKWEPESFVNFWWKLDPAGIKKIWYPPNTDLDQVFKGACRLPNSSRITIFFTILHVL